MSARKPTEADRLSAAYARTVATLVGRNGPSSGSGRLRRFGVVVDVNARFLDQEPVKAREIAREMLIEQTTRPFRGPRGGRYERVGEPFAFAESPEPNWDRGLTTFRALVMARYVRPSHRTN